jgi:hypothetical protein
LGLILIWRIENLKMDLGHTKSVIWGDGHGSQVGAPAFVIALLFTENSKNV